MCTFANDPATPLHGEKIHQLADTLRLTIISIHNGIDGNLPRILFALASKHENVSERFIFATWQTVHRRIRLTPEKINIVNCNRAVYIIRMLPKNYCYRVVVSVYNFLGHKTESMLCKVFLLLRVFVKSSDIMCLHDTRLTRNGYENHLIVHSFRICVHLWTNLVFAGSHKLI